MPESPLNPQESVPPAASRRMIRWDAVAAIIASLVGLLALVVGGYTAYIQREQVQAQVWPYLLPASSDVSAEYMWLNNGSARQSCAAWKCWSMASRSKIGMP